jgi:hypothetical protein
VVGIPEGEVVKWPGRDASCRAIEEEDAECNDSRKNHKNKNEKKRRSNIKCPLMLRLILLL